MDDKNLRDDVFAALVSDPLVPAAAIDLTVQNGQVTLTGRVSSYAEKQAAEAAARRVHGVTSVVQHIVALYPPGKHASDDEIAERVGNLLQWSALLPASVIHSEVQNGQVTLSGRVNWQYEREIAENAVKVLGGVTGIINNVQITSGILSENVKRCIEDVLRRSATDWAVTVSVRGDGLVKLEGTVHSAKDRQLAERAVWSTPGVRSVEDLIEIV